MRLSPWHLELAKRIAQGQPNRDIMKEIQISPSRLSVLKANPLFVRAIEDYRKKEADKYTKAIEVFADKAEEVAKEITHLATSPLTPHNIRLQAGLSVLEKLAQAEGVIGGNGKNAQGEELVFEQMLRVTRKSMGQDKSASDLDDSGFDDYVKDLQADLINIAQAASNEGDNSQMETQQYASTSA